jgi:hypothetical protein
MIKIGELMKSLAQIHHAMLVNQIDKIVKPNLKVEEGFKGVQDVQKLFTTKQDEHDSLQNFIDSLPENDPKRQSAIDKIAELQPAKDEAYANALDALNSMVQQKNTVFLTSICQLLVNFHYAAEETLTTTANKKERFEKLMTKKEKKGDRSEKSEKKQEKVQEKVPEKVQEPPRVSRPKPPPLDSNAPKTSNPRPPTTKPPTDSTEELISKPSVDFSKKPVKSSEEEKVSEVGKLSQKINPMMFNPMMLQKKEVVETKVEIVQTKIEEVVEPTRTLEKTNSRQKMMHRMSIITDPLLYEETKK